MAGSSNARFVALRIWLFPVAGLIVAMVLVGGATRLTGSGLSIVEWQLVTGTLPPLSDQHWHEAFSAYQQIPQYRQLNAGMTLAEFKTIFSWEWSHRLLGRVIGLAYLVPFLWFIWRGGLERTLQRRLWLIFALGALQGAVGWWMVSSGLTQRVEVAHERLAIHRTLALAIFAAIIWTLQRLGSHHQERGPKRPRFTAAAQLVLVFVLLFMGALVAGLRAGQIYDTWPLIDGARPLLSALLLQAGTGVLTLLYQVPIGLGLVHQGLAVPVLTLAVVHLARLWPPCAPQFHR